MLTETTNGVTTQYTYDNNDRILTAGNISYTYDNNGNTLTESGNGNNKTFSYNAQNELVSATQNSINATFTYDADGIRSSRTMNSVTTNFVTDKNRDYAQVVAEVENGTTKATYTYGADLISQNRSGAASYYLYDALGSVKALSDSTGAVTDKYNYTAFGKDLNHTGTTTNNYKFAGEQYDGALDNYYLRHRYYNQNIGRFTQQDSWNGNSQDPITLHKYLYAGVNPVSYTDPSGNSFLTEFMAAYTVQGVLTSAAIGGTFGAIDAALDPELSDADIVRRGLEGAAFGGALGPIGWIRNVRVPFTIALSGLGAKGCYDSFSQGKNWQGGFRCLGAALSGFTAISSYTSNVVSASEGFSASNAYSGVFNAKGGIALKPSFRVPPGGTVPPGGVPATGGHAQIANEFFPGADPRVLFGFTIFPKAGGRFDIDFNSGSVNNPNTTFRGNIVPAASRAPIIRAIESTTGMKVDKYTN